MVQGQYDTWFFSDPALLDPGGRLDRGTGGRLLPGTGSVCYLVVFDPLSQAATQAAVYRRTALPLRLDTVGRLRIMQTH